MVFLLKFCGLGPIIRKEKKKNHLDGSWTCAVESRPFRAGDVKEGFVYDQLPDDDANPKGYCSVCGKS